MKSFQDLNGFYKLIKLKKKSPHKKNMLDVSLFCLLLSVTTAHVVTPEQFGAGMEKLMIGLQYKKTVAACTNQTNCRSRCIDF